MDRLKYFKSEFNTQGCREKNDVTSLGHRWTFRFRSISQDVLVPLSSNFTHNTSRYAFWLYELWPTFSQLISAIKWNDNIKIKFWVSSHDFCAAWYQPVTNFTSYNLYIFSMYLALKQRFFICGSPSATLTQHCVNPGWTAVFAGNTAPRPHRYVETPATDIFYSQVLLQSTRGVCTFIFIYHISNGSSHSYWACHI